MIPTIAANAGLEDRLLAFERAVQTCAPAERADLDLEPFLPDADDPRRIAVLVELIRLALEFGYEAGRPWSIDDYRARFPELGGHPKAVADIAFEEFRLKVRGGLKADPIEYERSGVNVDYWPELIATRPKPSVEEIWNQSDLELEKIASGFRDCGTCSPSLDFDTLDFVSKLKQTQPHLVKELADVYASMPKAGDHFLDFRLESELGRGAFGRVFLARQTSLATRRVVLKIVAAGLERDESQTLARLHHSNIVPIHSAHRQGVLFAICMPYMGEHTLEHVAKSRLQTPTRRTGSRSWSRSRVSKKGERTWASLASGETRQDGAPPSGSASTAGASAPSPRPSRRLSGWVRRFSDIEEILRVVAKLAGGLDYAHRRGFAHGDLKPANILLANDGEPKLLDFNLARKLRTGGGFAADRLGGTLPYMAPEQLSAIAVSSDQRPPADPRSDLYALGVILHELLTGRSLFESMPGPIELIVPMMLRQHGRPRTPLRELNPEVSPAVEAIVSKCLAPNPEDRYQSARNLRADLHLHLRNRPLRYAPDSSWRERWAKWRKRHPKSVLAVMAIAATVLLGLAFAIGSSRVEEEQFLAELTEQGNQVRLSMLELDKGTDVLMAVLSSDLYNFNRLYTNRGEANLGAIQSLALWPTERAQARRLNGLFVASKALALAVQARRLRLSHPGEDFSDHLLASALSANNAAIQIYPQGEAPNELADRAWRWLRDPDERPAAFIDPSNLSGQDAYWRALEFLAFNRPDEALKFAEHAHRQEPSDPWHIVLQAVCQYDLGHRKAALELFAASIERLPKLERLRYWRGLMQTEHAKELESRGRFDDAAEAAEIAIDDFDEVLESGRDTIRIRLDRAQANIILGRYDSALEDLEDCQNSMKSLFLKAQCLEGLDRVHEAAEARRAALSLDPVDAYDYFFRAVNLLDDNQALEDLKIVLKLKPRFIPAHLLLAQIFVRHERFDEAAQALAFVESRDPGNAEAQRLRRRLDGMIKLNGSISR